MDELIERLGFWIDRSGATAVLREVGGGCHPATRSELALWDALEAAREASPAEGEGRAITAVEVTLFGRACYLPADIAQEVEQACAAPQAEIEALRAEVERLDSGTIRIIERDEFGMQHTTAYSGVDLRAAIDQARGKGVQS